MPKVNETLLTKVVIGELSSSIDEMANIYARRATVEDMAILHAILNSTRPAREVLLDLVIFDKNSTDREALGG